MQLKGAFKMKKFVSLLLALMMALGMTALAEESKDQLARIQEKGEIVIATEGTWAPWTYTDENGNLVGFDVEIATAIAEKLGVKATFVTVEWDGILAGIDSGRYDIAANGIDVTEQRSEKYNFSTPYAFNRTALVVRGDKTGVLEVCVPGAAELNLKELAAVSGNKHVEMVPLKEVQPLTGYIRGGCSPLAGKKHYPVFVDESAILHERIYVSAGHRGVQLRLAPDDLLRAVEGTYAAIARY